MLVQKDKQKETECYFTQFSTVFFCVCRFKRLYIFCLFNLPLVLCRCASPHAIKRWFNLRNTVAFSKSTIEPYRVLHKNQKLDTVVVLKVGKCEVEMSGKALRLKVEIHIQAVSCPGVFFHAKGPVIPLKQFLALLAIIEKYIKA